MYTVTKLTFADQYRAMIVMWLAVSAHTSYTDTVNLKYKKINKKSLGVRKPTILILTRSVTNQAVQLLEMARGLKLWI